MASEWRITTLGECADVSSSKRIFASDYTDSGVPFYRSKEIIERAAGNKVSTSLFISDDKFEGVRDKFGAPVAGDILITSVGTIGVSYLVQPGDKFYFKDGNLTWLRNYKDGVAPQFIHLWLRSSTAKAEIDRVTIGSTQQALTIVSLKSLPLALPSLTDQKAIAHILGSLDDKIELNRQINQTLESMAQALFKSWFVDFDPVIDNALAAGNPIPEALQARAATRQAAAAASNGDQPAVTSLPAELRQQFPSEFEFTEEMGWVPKGWSIQPAEDIWTVTIGKTPPRKKQDCFSETRSANYVWVSIRDMGEGRIHIVDSREYLTPESVAEYNVKKVPAGSVLLSFKMTLGRVAIADVELTTNEAIAHFADSTTSMTPEFMYCYLKQFDFDVLGSTSSIATAVNSKIIKAMPLLSPCNGSMRAFDTTVAPLFNRVRRVNNQNSQLSALRDALLPKLISGELRIPDAEKLVVEAAL